MLRAFATEHSVAMYVQVIEVLDSAGGQWGSQYSLGDGQGNGGCKQERGGALGGQHRPVASPEGPDRLGAIHGIKKPMEPLVIITVGNHDVAVAPTHICTGQCLTTFIGPHLAEEGQNAGDRHGACTGLIHLYMIQLSVSRTIMSLLFNRPTVSGAKICAMATSPLPQGSPTLSTEKKSEMATSPLPSQGPRYGQWLHKPYCLGGPQRSMRGGNQKWPPHPCRLGGANMGNGSIARAI